MRKSLILLCLILGITSLSYGWGIYLDDVADVESPYADRANNDVLVWNSTLGYFEIMGIAAVGNNSFLRKDIDDTTLFNLTVKNLTVNGSGIFNGTGEPAIECPGNMAIVGINASGRVNASSLQGEGGNVTNVNATSWQGYLPFMGESLDPTGFTNRTDSTLSWNNATMNLTINGTYYFWNRGVKYTDVNRTIQIANTTGQHWIYYNDTNVLTEIVGTPGWQLPIIASVYWNNVTQKGLMGDERHGFKMDFLTHGYLHDTVGTRYFSGLTGTFADATFSVSAGQIYDEDIAFPIGVNTTCTVMFKNGTAEYQWLEGQTKYYYEDGASDINYNNGNSLAAVGANLYCAYWIFATNDPATPILSLMGQRQDTTIAAARTGNTYERLALGTLPFQEMKLLYRVILRNDATPYEEAQDYRSVSNLPAGTYVATAHNVLSGLTTGDDHPQYVLNEGDAGNINMTGRVNATSLQGEGGNITGLSAGTDGSALINLNGANISSGTIPEARIANASTWTAKLATTGSAAALTSIPGGNLTANTATGAGIDEGTLSLKNQTKGFVILNVNTTDDFRLPKWTKAITITNITGYLLGPASLNCTLEENNVTGNGTNKIIATMNLTNNTEFIGAVTIGGVGKGNYTFFNISAIGAGNGTLTWGMGYDEN
jgi:hypothetical protein